MTHDEEVAALHVRAPSGCGPDICDYCSAKEQEWNQWPCDTIRALRGEQP